MNLWLDDVRPPLIGYEWAKTVEQAKRLLLTGEVQRASLDHDLGLCEDCDAADAAEKLATVRASLLRNEGAVSFCSCPHTGTGYQLVCWMEETGHWPKEKPVVHSANPVGAKRMRQAIERHYSKVPA